jgi:hypothetical protein
MKSRFATISGGEYAQILYDKFGRERVDGEMNEFLHLCTFKTPTF